MEPDNNQIEFLCEEDSECLHISIIEKNQALTLKPQKDGHIGCQYDNEARRIVFSRPSVYERDDLVLYFALLPRGAAVGIPCEPINLGVENEFVLTADLTLCHGLELQIAFLRDRERLAHSDTVTFTLRSSVSKQAPEPVSWPARLRAVRESAIVEGNQVGSRVYLLNEEGEARFSFKVGDGEGGGNSPYIGDNGNWFEWDGEEYADTGVLAQGREGEAGTQGPQGIQGPEGPNVISSNTSVSGFTGAGGKYLGFNAAGTGLEVKDSTGGGIASTLPNLSRILNNGNFSSGMCFVKSAGGNTHNLTASDFEQGSIASATGLNSVSDGRLRTINYYPVYGGVEMNVSVSFTRTQGTHFQISLFYYDSNYSFISPSTGWVSDGSWKSDISTTSIPPSGAAYLKFIVSDNWGASITPDIAGSAMLSQGGESIDQLWAFAPSDDDHVAFNGTCRRYVFDDASHSLIQDGYFTHNWGHVNSVSYCPETDTIICGNGSSDYGLAGEFYVFEGASRFADMPSVPLAANSIVIPAIGYGSKVNAVWGENNGLRFDIAYLITNDARNMKKIQLGKGNNNLGLGSFQSRKSDKQFNGSYMLLLECSQSDGVDVVQGAVFHGGKLFLGLGHSGCLVATAVLNEDGSIRYRVYLENTRSPSGTPETFYAQSPGIRDSKLYLGTTNGTLREYDGLPD